MPYKPENIKAGIYKITNKNNGKIYIGSANNLARRKTYHFCDFRKGKAVNKRLTASLKHHGIKAYEFQILEVVDVKGLNNEERELYLAFIEQIYVDILKPEYNIKKKDVTRNIGVKGKVVPEQCKKIAVFDSDENFIEIVYSLREAYRKYKVPPHQIRKIAEGKANRPSKGYLFKYEGDIDKPLSFIKRNAKLEKNPRSIKVDCFNMEEVYLKSWGCIKVAAIELGIKPATLQAKFRKTDKTVVGTLILKIKK